MYLGIEIGGTKLQLGIGQGDGVIHALWRDTVVPAEGAEGIRRQIEKAVPELLTQANLNRDQLQGVGIGFGGPVDDATRTVIKSHQIQGWDGFPLADWIAELVGLPAVLGNDADVAGLAEALFGAGKGMSPIFYITIGSGIGGGLIIEGEIYRGCGRGAAEIGHTKHPLRVNTLLHDHEPLEHAASGWGIARLAEQLVVTEPCRSSVLADVSRRTGRISAEDVAKAATAGDVFAKSILDCALDLLANGICNVIALLCPRRIIIGGGVSLMGDDLYFKPLRQKTAARVFKPFADCYDIVPAALDEEVVVHGALALARKRFLR
jgi:glucokinase